MAKYSENSKLFTYLDNLSDTYKEPMKRVDGLYRNPRQIINRIEFYTNDQFESGQEDALGREKPFYNVCNFRVTVAKTATDLDVKDISFNPDSLKFSVQAMLYNHELYKWMKESNFSKALNDMGETRPRYGGLLVKKYEADGELEIQVVDWVNVEFNPTSIMGSPICEEHWMLPSEFSEKSDVWDNVEEVLKQHAREAKNKPVNIKVREYEGFFPESLFDDEGSEYKYDRYNVKIACIGTKKYLLKYEVVKESQYKYLPWEAIGESLGRGVVEQGFQAQVWTNDAMITMKNAMELSGKVILATDSNTISGNAITGVDHGHIFQMEQGRSLTSVNLQASALPEFHNLVELWKAQYDNSASVHGANSGEAPPSGTPYSQTALLNQVANSPFEYQREVWGIFLNEILNDWVKPFLKKRIMAEHYLVSEFDDEELAIIDNSIADYEARQILKENMLKGKAMSAEEYVQAKEAIKTGMNTFGKKREIKIPKGYLDIEGNITANITGELKNKAAMLQSLDGIMKNLLSTYDPNTQTFGALQDPVLKRIFGQIIELAGVPISLDYTQKSQPVNTQADLSAISPVPVQAGAAQ